MLRYASVDTAIINAKKLLNIELEKEFVGLDSLLGRISAEELRSPIDIPPTDRSAVDGFAVCSESVSSASPNNPIPLVVASSDKGSISCGETVPISTGDPLPEGADAVVMLEDTEREGGTLLVMRSAAKYDNVSRKGEDFEKGKIVIERGTVIRPWHLASISTVGMRGIIAYRKIRVGIIATGSEVTEPGGEGFIFDSTSRLIASYFSEQGFFDVKRYGIVKDDIEMIASFLMKAAKESDVIITTGGTGPGSRDLSINALLRAGGKLLVRGIAMRPGRPTSYGELEGKPVFLLSGYPVAAFVGARFIILPFIEEKIGIKDDRLKFVFARLKSRVAGEGGLESFIRVKLNSCGNELCAEPILLRGSGILSSLLKSGGFLRVPANVEGFEEGEIVRIELA
ncbi:MAG: molybdopterin molybdotransferase MoeA [Fervidicoccaceae archaeon]